MSQEVTSTYAAPHWLRRPQPLFALTPFPAWTKAAGDTCKGQWLMPSLPPFCARAELRLTLHARRPEVLPREEDGVIVVLVVTCVRLLLEVSPAADILQALRGVPDLNEAHGLQGGGRDRSEGLASGGRDGS